MPQDRNLWDAALREVQSRVLTEVRTCGLTVAQKGPLYRLYQFCQRQIEAGPLAPAPTNRELASKYGVSLRTATNWRREGCPFDAGQVKVLDWLAERRYVPAGTREKFAGQLAKRDSFPFISRQFWQANDQVRQLKRDYLNDGLEPPAWLKPFRATRRTKGIPTGSKAKRQPIRRKGAKRRARGNYHLKFLVAASKVAAAD